MLSTDVSLDSGDLDIKTKLQLFYEINLYGTKMSDEDLERVQSLLKVEE